MARKKRRGGRKGKNWVDKVFEVLGIVVAAAPAIKGVKDSITTPENIPRGIAYNYTGFDYATGGFSWQQAASGIGTVAVGGVVASIPRIFRAVRNMIRGR